MKKKLVSKGCYGYIRNHRMVAGAAILAVWKEIK